MDFFYCADRLDSVAATTAVIIAKCNSLLSNVPLRIVKGNHSFFPALYKGEEKYGVGWALMEPAYLFFCVEHR